MEIKTNLKGFVRNFKHRSNWGRLWKLDGSFLNDAQARIFVSKAIEAGYETDTEVPEDLVRKWLGLTREERNEK